MEEINSMILYGCKLARDLEFNLQNFSNQPNKVLNSCDEIARVFTAVRDRLNPSPYEPPVVAEIAGGDVPDWLRFGVTQAMGTLLQSQIFQGLTENRAEISGDLSGGGGGVGGHSGGGELAMEVAYSGKGGSISRPKRRKDVVDKRTIMVPAPRMGNTEIPPEDGHTWRKYGQKEILGSRFPRSYYRCTHQKMYQCPAKKQVQRLDDDPFTFHVTYRGDHTCHMSSTAPSNQTLPPQHPITRWLSMNLSPASTGEGFRSSALGAGTSGGGAGPPTVRFGPEGDYPLQVADLADAMFNTGNSGNSLDLIFCPTVGEEPQDKTK